MKISSDETTKPRCDGGAKRCRGGTTVARSDGPRHPRSTAEACPPTDPVCRSATRQTLVSSIVVLTVLAGCSFDALLHQTASLGGNVAGQRGEVEVLFINNTPYRAIFTFGAYDEFDRDTIPDIAQFSSSSQTLTLEGNSSSDVLPGPCHRVMAIGTQGLIDRIRRNLDENTVVEEALVEGVNFSSAPADDDLADEPTEGKAAGVEALIGIDYECNSMVIYRFEVSDVGPEPFEVRISIIPSESTR